MISARHRDEKGDVLRGCMTLSIKELCTGLINGRGGACVSCDIRHTFIVTNSQGVPVKIDSPSKNHDLSPGNIALRVECDAIPEPHRPLKGSKSENCRPRRHMLQKA